MDITMVALALVLGLTIVSYLIWKIVWLGHMITFEIVKLFLNDPEGDSARDFLRDFYKNREN